MRAEGMVAGSKSDNIEASFVHSDKPMLYVLFFCRFNMSVSGLQFWYLLNGSFWTARETMLW